MILDQLKNAEFYSGLHQGLDTAFHYLQSTDLAKIEPGNYEIDGSDVYAIVQEYDTKPREEKRWEAHRQYLDVQYVFKGVERIGYAPLEQLQAGEYNEARDFLPLTGEGDFFVVAREGTFAILGPEDGHMPGVALASPQPVKKVVVKVRIAGK